MSPMGTGCQAGTARCLQGGQEDMAGCHPWGQENVAGVTHEIEAQAGVTPADRRAAWPWGHLTRDRSTWYFLPSSSRDSLWSSCRAHVTRVTAAGVARCPLCPPLSPCPLLTRFTSFFSSSSSFSFCFLLPPPFSEVVAAGEYSRPAWGHGAPVGHAGTRGPRWHPWATPAPGSGITMGMDVTASMGVTVATGILEGSGRHRGHGGGRRHRWQRGHGGGGHRRGVWEW